MNRNAKPHQITEGLTKRLDNIADARHESKEIPYMDMKDVARPEKFNGNKWLHWSMDFMSFLTRRDRRWK